MIYTLYVLKCGDGSLYTGIALDLNSRLAKHKLGTGAKYVRAHMPFTLVYQEQLPDKSTALKREIEIKKWSRQQKLLRFNLG
jgi:putative endonuclease